MSKYKNDSNVNNIISENHPNSIIIKTFLEKEGFKICSKSDVSYHFEKEIEKFSIEVFLCFSFSPMWVSIKTYFADELYNEDCSKLMISKVEDLEFLLSRINLNNFFIRNVTFYDS